MSYDINEEWHNFISSDCVDDDDISDNEIEDINSFIQKDEEFLKNLSFDYNSETPKASDIYISTKTKIAYLSKKINLKNTFWEIPVSPYHTAGECVVKKQMKFNSSNEEELQDIQNRLREVSYSESWP